MTLAHMRRLVLREMVHPAVRALASRLAGSAGTVDPLEQARAIRSFVADRTVFVRDPHGVELLHAPSVMVKRILTEGYAPIDCDDVAILAAALGKAVGLRARFVVVGFGSPHAPFRHVWAELSPPRSPRWMEMDVTRPAQPLPFQMISRRSFLEI